MKKNILFMVINMNIGGTEKALLNLISELPSEEYEITLFMLEKRGEFLKEIPRHVHIKYMDGYKEIKPILNRAPMITARQMMRSGNIGKASLIATLHLISKVMGERSVFYNYLLRNMTPMKEKYDIAIAYAGPMDLISYLIATKIRAKKKVQWIHFDVDQIGFNKRFTNKTYKSFDKIFVVSNEGRRKLINKLPTIKNKTDVFLNVISAKKIQKMAQEGRGFNDSFDGLRIVTVGRLTFEKGHDLAIVALSKLIDHGFNIKWYFVGKGHLKKDYEQMAEKLNIRDHLVFLGEDPNPYQYIASSDIYVQPSRHEGYCITLSEAKVLQKPIVTTNFTGAKEQIKNDDTGLIVNIEATELYQALKTLISNPELRKTFSERLDKQSKKNKVELQRFDELV